MRLYLELYEVLPEGSEEEADFIRVDVTEWDPMDRETLKQKMIEYANSTYEHYVIYLHYCNHDAGGGCSFEEVAER